MKIDTSIQIQTQRQIALAGWFLACVQIGPCLYVRRPAPASTFKAPAWTARSEAVAVDSVTKEHDQTQLAYEKNDPV